jgi:hypothetical protein
VIDKMTDLELKEDNIEELHNVYNNLFKNEMIGGYSKLNDFSKKCFEFAINQKEFRIPFFVIYSIFNEIADDQYEREVTEDEGKNLYKILNPWIQEFFNEMKSNREYTESLNQFINSFYNLFYSKE